MSGAATSRYLEVDLSSGAVARKELDRRDVELYVGGRGLGARLLYDQTRPGLDPYDPGMALIFSAGPLTGTSAPQSNRFVVTTKSPLTGLIADSHCGGSFATKLRKAGYDAVLIRGRAEQPVYLEITDEKVEIKDAAHLWGKTTAETQAALPKRYGKAVIGPAGEHLVRYAAIVSQTRLAGRTGVGAVMGSKNLKAVIADGQQEIPVADRDAFKKLQKEITEFLQQHPMTGRILPELGTANIVMPAAGRNIMPVRNFQTGHDLRIVDLAGEKMRDELLLKHDGCISCPIHCGRHVKVDGGEGKGPEFETIGLLGSNLGIFDLPAVIQLGIMADELGMDSISLGSSLAFATELTERGMLASDLAWGNVAAYRAAIEDIAYRRGLGDDLADGTKRMAERHGGKDFAINVKGLELPAYDPRGCVGQGLEYATTSRGGCHIRGSTMFLEATGPVSVDPVSPKAKPELVILQQNTNASISALSMCYFAAYAMIPAAIFNLDPNSLVYRVLMKVMLNAGPAVQLVLKLKNPAQLLWFEKFLSVVTGRTISMGDLNEIGERIMNLERLYNLREGLKPEVDDTLPPRMLNEPTSRYNRGVPLGEMLPRYYGIRGWDRGGVPTEKTIARLQIRR
ncbi:MAG TPA: aldehyde ferredoxin oxidoreductase family protein [Polyangia bacterium]|jgi:aldehyde:ferredoxin oxidoreductase